MRFSCSCIVVKDRRASRGLAGTSRRDGRLARMPVGSPSGREARRHRLDAAADRTGRRPGGTEGAPAATRRVWASPPAALRSGPEEGRTHLKLRADGEAAAFAVGALGIREAPQADGASGEQQAPRGGARPGHILPSATAAGLPAGVAVSANAATSSFISARASHEARQCAGVPGRRLSRAAIARRRRSARRLAPVSISLTPGSFRAG